MTTSFLSSLRERPIFSRQLIRHNPPHPVAFCVASNLQICLVLANKSVQRINQAAKKDASAPAAIETLDLSKWVGTASKIVNAFLDPLGAHLVLVLKPVDASEGSQPDILYLNNKSGKPKLSSKIKGHLVTSVSWLSTNTSDAVTGPVLMGTSK